jgi:hypothetical protein
MITPVLAATFGSRTACFTCDPQRHPLDGPIAPQTDALSTPSFPSVEIDFSTLHNIMKSRSAAWFQFRVSRLLFTQAESFPG